METEETPVHVLSLENPCRAGLIEERPETSNEKVNRGELAHREEAFFSESLAQEIDAACGHVDKAVPAHPEYQGGDSHQRSGNSEGPVRPVPLQQPRRQQH